MRDILIIGIILAVIVILVRVAVGTPMIRRVMESFTSSMINNTTECPAGSQMYMYEGAALCCSNQIKPDANSLAESCSKGSSAIANTTFCSLGPSQKGVPNCLEIKNNKFAEERIRFCPPAAPNYVKGPPGSATENGRCCASIENAGYTDCIDAAGSCTVNPSSNLFTTTPQPSCQLLKAQAEDGACPASYSPMIFPINDGAFAGLSLYGCFNPMKGGCLDAATINRLKQLGYDVAGLPVCAK